MPLWAWIVCASVLALAGLFAYGRIMFQRKYMTDDPEAFMREIAAYRKADAADPPVSGAALFVGSSIMEQWKTLGRDLSPLPVLNRAISGSKIVQWPHYVDELVLPHRPSAVVLFAGSNDMHGDRCKPPERILEAFAEFERKIHAALPAVKVWYLSIFPSPSPDRWGNWDRIQTANRLIREYAEKRDDLGFIDATDAFLENGKPIPALFLPDMVHLNARGYERWAGVVKPYFIQA